MLDNVVSMFDDRKALVGKIKKAAYEANMPVYREKYGHFYTEMINAVEGSEDETNVANEIADCFVKQVFDGFAKNGKVGSGKVLDLNFMMVYYFFPGLLLTGSDKATVVADAIKAKWNATFNCGIEYGTYDFIMEGFKKKLFGFW